MPRLKRNPMNTTDKAAQIFNLVVQQVIDQGVFDADMLREIADEIRKEMVEAIARKIDEIKARRAAALISGSGGVRQDFGLRKPKERSEANLAAMRLLATADERELTQAEREVVSKYSGWGGLSIEGVSEWPDGFRPEARGLIHEYYTPIAITDAIVSLILPMVSALPTKDGKLHALEPSAGIGRFVDSLYNVGVKAEVQAVEYSEVSSALLSARFPQVDVHVGSFESWVAANGDRRFGLVLANPPYGERGIARTEDRADFYRQRDDGTYRNAYAYFMRRASDLVEPNGLAVWIIPAGFMHGTGEQAKKLRQRVLRRHHLEAAYRLPSGTFPGAMLVVDVVILRARKGALKDLLASDSEVLEGKYFEQYPEHILGKEIGKKGEDDNQTKKPRFGYQVEGKFDKFPPYNPRPMVHGEIDEDIKVAPTKQRASVRRNLGVNAELSGHLETAARLGVRADYLLGQQRAAGLSELALDIRDWVAANGNPHADAALVNEAKSDDALKRFLNVVEKNGEPLASISDASTMIDLGTDAPATDEDLIKFAQNFYANNKLSLNISNFFAALAERGWKGKRKGLLPFFFEKGWNYNPTDASLFLDADYYTGNLWPKYDAVVYALDSEDGDDMKAQLEIQKKRLIEIIKPESIDTIKNSPKDRWVPDVVILDWIGYLAVNGGFHKVGKPSAVSLLSKRISEIDFDGVSNKTWHLAEETDRLTKLINPPSKRIDISNRENLDCYYNMGHFSLVIGGEKTINYPKIRAGSENENLNRGEDLVFIGAHGAYASLSNILGFINNDRSMFKPIKEGKESLDDARERYEKQLHDSWIEFVESNPDATSKIENGYNRAFKGRVPVPLPLEAPPVLRWNSAKVVLHDYQQASVNKLAKKRGGLLALDVGLGKTYTGLYTLALARQQGWARRPVIVVPNTLALKWKKDILRVLPDYRVVVIGVKEGVFSRGAKAGFDKAEPDGSEERGRKWTEFQLGMYDVAVVTQSVIGCTRVNRSTIEQYSEGASAIQFAVKEMLRMIADKDRARESFNDKLAKKPELMNDPRTKKALKEYELTEREKAIAAEGAVGFIAEMLEAPSNMSWDTGPAWDDIGVDFLMVDEAQRYKNLWMAAPRVNGVPMYMGGSGDGSGLAWYMDFRCWSVRERTGGAGVVLLSATPAKNSPLEIYNLVQYTNPKAFLDLYITNPEAFVERYIEFGTKRIVTPAGELVDKSYARSFQNLHEIRSILNEECEFKTADEVGLPIPEADAEVVYLDFDSAQSKAYEELRKLFEEAVENSAHSGGKGQCIAIMSRMSMVCVHPMIDTIKDRKLVQTKDKFGEYIQVREKLDMKAEWEKCINMRTGYESPKITKCTENIIGNKHCAHIVFCENILAHALLYRSLEDAGFNMKRVAFLNGFKTKSVADRQAIAEAFNGSPERPSAYDVVICNSVAYEGIDLQVRTCQIHHLDLPYEFATLQQRNGRGVRQGNKYLDAQGRSIVKIWYYVMSGSLDIHRQQMIKGKRGWMTSLVKGQDRSTNNPANEGEDDDMLIALMNKDPEKARSAILKLRERSTKLDNKNATKFCMRKFNAISELWYKMLSDVGFNAPKSSDPYRLFVVQVVDRMNAILRSVSAIEKDTTSPIKPDEKILEAVKSGQDVIWIGRGFRTAADSQDDKEGSGHETVFLRPGTVHTVELYGTNANTLIGSVNPSRVFINNGRSTNGRFAFQGIEVGIDSQSPTPFKDIGLAGEGVEPSEDYFATLDKIAAAALAKPTWQATSALQVWSFGSIAGLRLSEAPKVFTDRYFDTLVDVVMRQIKEGGVLGQSVPYLLDGKLGFALADNQYGNRVDQKIPPGAKIMVPNDFTAYAEKIRDGELIDGFRREVAASIARDWFGGKVLRSVMFEPTWKQQTVEDVLAVYQKNKAKE